jgi:hypothetical protein
MPTSRRQTADVRARVPAGLAHPVLDLFEGFAVGDAIRAAVVRLRDCPEALLSEICRLFDLPWISIMRILRVAPIIAELWLRKT